MDKISSNKPKKPIFHFDQIVAKLKAPQLFVNMSSSESRVEYMKPFLLKAGIPAALSVGAYICARIVSKRSDKFMETLSNRLQQSSSQPFHNSLNSTISDCSESEDQGTESLQEGNLVDKLLELEIQLKDIKNKEWDLESRFLRYQNMRDKEMMLMEIRSMKMMQKARAESLLKEISSMEDDNERLGGLVKECMKLMNEVKGLKSENRLLRRKARKQGRRAKHRLRVIRKRQKLCIEARDAELLNNQIEIEMRTNHIQQLEDDICQLKGVVDDLQRDKIELYNKIYLAEKSDSSNHMIQTGGVTKEDYEEILKELEQLKKIREVEAKELTYIKWSNACLRRKMLDYHEQQDHRKGEEIVELEGNNNNGTEEAAANHNEMHEWSGTLVAQEDHEPGLGTGGQVHSKRKRLIQKLKKWVDGGGKMDEKLDKNDEMVKCFGRLTVSEDELVHARISCSSV